MNLLAHAVLAGSDPGLVVGGVLGDWIKGPLDGGLSDDLSAGVRLHRRIDARRFQISVCVVLLAAGCTLAVRTAIAMAR